MTYTLPERTLYISYNERNNVGPHRAVLSSGSDENRDQSINSSNSSEFRAEIKGLLLSHLGRVTLKIDDSYLSHDTRPIEAIVNSHNSRLEAYGDLPKNAFRRPFRSDESGTYLFD